jgi:hypothetical protein
VDSGIVEANSDRILAIGSAEVVTLQIPETRKLVNYLDTFYKCNICTTSTRIVPEICLRCCILAQNSKSMSASYYAHPISMDVIYTASIDNHTETTMRTDNELGSADRT